MTLEFLKDEEDRDRLFSFKAPELFQLERPEKEDVGIFNDIDIFPILTSGGTKIVPVFEESIEFFLLNNPGSRVCDPFGEIIGDEMVDLCPICIYTVETCLYDRGLGSYGFAKLLLQYERESALSLHIRPCTCGHRLTRKIYRAAYMMKEGCEIKSTTS